MADSYHGLYLVSAPADLDLFGTHIALVEAVWPHGAEAHRPALGTP